MGMGGLAVTLQCFPLFSLSPLCLLFLPSVFMCVCVVGVVVASLLPLLAPSCAPHLLIISTQLTCPTSLATSATKAFLNSQSLLDHCIELESS